MSTINFMYKSLVSYHIINITIIYYETGAEASNFTHTLTICVGNETSTEHISGTHTK